MDLTNHSIVLNAYDKDTRNSVFTLDSRDPITLNIPVSCQSSDDTVAYIKQYCSDLLDTEADLEARAAAMSALNNSIGQNL